MKLQTNQSIISTASTIFDVKVFFLATLVKKQGIFQIRTDDIDQNKARKAIKDLELDYKDSKVSAYCISGHSFKEQWNKIPESDKVRPW